jgi:hypothetical protein
MKIASFVTEHKIDNFARFLVYVSLLVLAVCTAVNLHALTDISVWRHDELYYEPDYFHKLEAEGRWLNYLLSDYLAKMPGFYCIITSYLALAVFCLKAAWNTNRNLLLACTIALVCLQFPFFSTQLFWPATTLPSFIVLLAACLLSEKIPKIVFFPLFAILFFGTLSHLYFLLPLLFLRELNLRETANLLVLWIVSFLIGFVVTQAITFQMTGHLIEIAGWRNPNPIQSWDDLFLNLSKMFGSFVQINKKLSEMVGLALVAGWGIVMLIDRRPRDIYMLTVVAVSALAVFASSIPLGLGVQGRTALTYSIGLIFLSFVRESASVSTRTLILILCTSIGVSLALSNLKTVNWYAGVTNEIKEEMRRAIPSYVNSDATIVLGISKQGWSKITKKIEICKGLTHVTGEKFNGGYRVRQALTELGFKNTAWCSKKCEAVPGRVGKSLKNCDRKIFETYRHKPDEVWLFAADNYLH